MLRPSDFSDTFPFLASSGLLGAHGPTWIADPFKALTLYPYAPLDRIGGSMLSNRYRIGSPTIALFLEDDRHVAHMVPAGSVVVVDSNEFNGDRLIEVLWAEKKVLMFTQDIRARGEQIIQGFR